MRRAQHRLTISESASKVMSEWRRRRWSTVSSAVVCVFHAIAITHSTATRSGIPPEADHPFHVKPITCSTESRSPVPREVDHLMAQA